MLKLAKRLPQWIAIVTPICLLGSALSGCDTDVRSPMAPVETVVIQSIDGAPLAMTRMVATHFMGDSWTRIAVVRDGLIVGVTDLARAARIDCRPQSDCQALVLRPGEFWPRAFTPEPSRFLKAPNLSIENPRVQRDLAAHVALDNESITPPGFRITTALVTGSFDLLSDHLMSGLAMNVLVIPVVFAVMLAARLIRLIGMWVAPTRWRGLVSLCVLSLAYGILAMPLIYTLLTEITATHAMREILLPEGGVRYDGKTAAECLALLCLVMATCGSFELLRSGVVYLVAGHATSRRPDDGAAVV